MGNKKSLTLMDLIKEELNLSSFEKKYKDVYIINPLTKNQLNEDVLTIRDYKIVMEKIDIIYNNIKELEKVKLLSNVPYPVNNIKKEIKDIKKFIEEVKQKYL